MTAIPAGRRSVSSLTLLESRRRHEWQLGSAASSAVVHGALIVALALATAGAHEQLQKPSAEILHFAELAPKEPPPPPDEPKALPANAVATTLPPPKGFQVLSAPIDIPDKIPDVDLSRAVTNEADFSGRGVAGGIARGVEGAKAPVPLADRDQPYFEFQVEKPVLPREGNPAPAYPALLANQRISGEVLVQYVVDTTGHVEQGSIRVLKSTDALFETSVRGVLPRLRFYPAEVGGHRVRQLVQQPFRFVLPE